MTDLEILLKFAKYNLEKDESAYESNLFMSTGQTLLDAAIKHKTKTFLDRFNEKFREEAQLIQEQFENGCGVDPFKDQENPLTIADGHDENFCDSLKTFFKKFHGWREDAFSVNSESCNQKVIVQMAIRHDRWEQKIRNFAKCNKSNEEE